jgi:hypothetical protein
MRRFLNPFSVGMLLYGAIAISDVAAAPTVTNVTSTVANGTYDVDAVIPISVQFSEAVTVTGSGFVRLSLQLNGYTKSINCDSGSGTSTLWFTYTVLSDDTASHLDYAGTTSLVCIYGDTIWDAATGLVPAVLTLPAPGEAGSLGANKTIAIQSSASAVRNLKTEPNFTGASCRTGVISYNLATDQRVSLSVYDLRGRIAMAVDKTCKAGAYSISLENLPRGSYVVAFKAGNSSHNSRFVVR